MAGSLGISDEIRAIPLVDPQAVHMIGLVVPEREPHMPAVSALLHVARGLAAKRVGN
jgi:hypothetical protein